MSEKATPKLLGHPVVVTLRGPLADAIREYDAQFEAPPGPSCIVRSAVRDFLTGRGIEVRRDRRLKAEDS